MPSSTSDFIHIFNNQINIIALHVLIVFYLYRHMEVNDNQS